MNIFFIHPFKIRRDPADKQTHGHTQYLHDKSEGSEFLDDAIHREDVQEIPVNYTEVEESMDKRQ